MGTITAGLEGVIAGESEICYIDGYQGVLSYRGYNIHTLADNAIFEEVIFLLWNGWLPKAAELDQLQKDLAAARGVPAPVLDFLQERRPKQSDGRAAHGRLDAEPVRSGSAGHVDGGESSQGRAADVETADIVTGFDRLRKGQAIVPGDPSLGFSANFLYTLTGKRPDDVMEKAFDVAMTLHADHELNASTFAARVTAATLSDIYSSITSGIGALKGPLHGGANQDVIKLLLQLSRRGRGGRPRQEHPGEKGQDSGLRASRVPHRRSARDAPARALRRARASAPDTRSSSACRSAWKRRSRPKRG